MGKRKTRLEKSKVSGKDARLEQLNTEAHKQLHEQGISHGAAQGGTFIQVYKSGLGD